MNPPSCACGFESETVTRAPRASKNSAAAAPDLPRPTTRILLSLTPISAARPLNRLCHGFRALAQLQCGESKECKYQRRHPEAHDHFGFRPSEQLEVVVQRRHLEDALLAELVRADLQDNRERFDDEDAADKGKQQLLLDDDCDGRDRAA